MPTDVIGVTDSTMSAKVTGSTLALEWFVLSRR